MSRFRPARRLLLLGLLPLLLAACSSIPFLGGSDEAPADGDETGSTTIDPSVEIDLINVQLLDLITRLDSLQAATPSDTPDPRIDELLAQVGALATAVPTPDPAIEELREQISALPTPTPAPTPTPDLRINDVLDRLAKIDSKVSTLEATVLATPTPTPSPTPGPKQVGLFIGSGNTQTETFRMERSPWEMTWAATSSPDATRLWVRLRSNTGVIISDIIDNNVLGPATGTTLVHGSVGTFYLDVVAGPSDAQGGWKFVTTELSP